MKAQVKKKHTSNTRKQISEGYAHRSRLGRRTKQTYLRSKYERLVARKGKKKALIAIGRKILCASYHILKNNKPYQELGYDYLGGIKKPIKSIRI